MHLVVSRALLMSNNTGWLMQQDLIQSFAPVMTARSDTFVIRCFGESRGGVGNDHAQVWLEAVVQRVPDPVDNTDGALVASGLGAATPLEQLNAVNQRFGRRYKIKSFRWLNKDEL